MQTLLSTLKKICSNNLIKEKLILMPTRTDGQQLIMQISKAGIPCLNLHIETTTSLSERVSLRYIYKRNLVVVSRLIAEHIVMLTMKELSQDGKLGYFKELEITPGVCKAIYDAILDLKLAALTPDRIRPDAFINQSKGLDLLKIYKHYQQLLEQRNMLDRVDLMRIAAEQIKDESPCEILIVPDWLELTPIEQQLIKGIDSAHRVTVSLTKVNSVEDIYKVKEKGPEFHINLFQAYGENNEIREVFRRIKQKGIPFEQTAIFYSSVEPYSQFCYDFAQKFNLPMTFGHGINILNTKPGRMLFGLLDWVESGFEVARLYPLLISGDWRLNNHDGLSGIAAVKLLHKAGVGWGRERYLAQLSKQLCGTRQDGKFQILIELLEKIFLHIPILQADQKVEYKAFVLGLAQLIESYSEVSNAWDIEAQSMITRQLRELASIAEESLVIGEAVQMVQELVSGIRVGSSGCKPGHIHVDGYEQGPWIARKNNFLVGLDAQRFPGFPKENPIILDWERSRLGALELKKLQPKKNMIKMLQTLVSLPGNVVLSYSACDPVENKEVYPSTLLLQIYRQQIKDQSKDYGDLLSSFPHSAGYTTPSLETALDSNEWWLKYQDEHGLTSSELLEHYRTLREGDYALTQRLTNSFGPYDGKVTVDDNLIDPRRNQQIVLSSSQLEKLATCPFGYFLRYVLCVQPLEDLQYDPSVWLDARTRGNLLHTVFERFYRGLQQRGEKSEFSKHETYIYELAEQVIEEMRALVPPPNETVFEQECKELLDSCRVFLVSEEENGVGLTPRFFELAFGMGQSGYSEAGGNQPVFIELPDGRGFYLRGKIDRVDQLSDGTYQVLDYKTGSCAKYNEAKYYQGGRQLQHTLYAIAFEQLLGRELGSVHVSAGGYLFPSVRGEGQRFLRQQSDRSTLYDLLEILLEILATGTFAMTDRGDDCKYCDYQAICNRDKINEAIAAKYGQNQDNFLELVRRLRTHE